MKQHVNAQLFGELNILRVVCISVHGLMSEFSFLHLHRYNLGGGDEEKTDVDSLDQEEYGWKIIHADVFRLPSNLPLFCAVIGVGTQFLGRQKKE